jgi:hypothetical protein
MFQMNLSTLFSKKKKKQKKEKIGMRCAHESFLLGLWRHSIKA